MLGIHSLLSLLQKWDNIGYRIDIIEARTKHTGQTQVTKTPYLTRLLINQWKKKVWK